ncbi:MAG: hypothetical protein MI723_10445 [Caulobacterales bacterium]|nr:hypothetical protein [Caulobacterales bacterium]
MLRVTIIEIALIALPFVLYLAYRWIVGSRRRAAGGTLNETPYQLLFFSGAALSLVALVTLVLLRGGDDSPARDRVYVPPQAVDGRIVRGHFITREEAERRGLVEREDGEAPADESDPDEGA